MRSAIPLLAGSLLLVSNAGAQTPEQLAKALERFPKADTNGDGTLTLEEAQAYRKKVGEKPAANKAAAEKHPTPTIAAGSYGPNPASIFDFWKAESEKPAPLLIFIHGGGFKAGNRKAVKPAFIEKARAEGFSVVSIDYPFLPEKPIQEILPSIARIVQFARHNAKEWNIDPDRIGVLGGSAGAGSSLWIAAHPDLADPKSDDPVARQSSRVKAAASINGQATYDLLKWEELVGPAPATIDKESDEPLRFYHLAPGTDLNSEAAKAARAKVDIHGLITSDTPPLFLSPQATFRRTIHRIAEPTFTARAIRRPSPRRPRRKTSPTNLSSAPMPPGKMEPSKPFPFSKSTWFPKRRHQPPQLLEPCDRRSSGKISKLPSFV